uniref:Uncharacterized protein n=1 Tax=Oryza punctata TaxID=4537 RepID=A0A0E0LSS4_ORYPU
MPPPSSEPLKLYQEPSFHQILRTMIPVAREEDEEEDEEQEAAPPPLRKAGEELAKSGDERRLRPPEFMEEFRLRRRTYVLGWIELGETSLLRRRARVGEVSDFLLPHPHPATPTPTQQHAAELSGCVK